MTDVDARLRAFHDSILATFAEQARELPAPSLSAPRLFRQRRYLIAIAAAALLAVAVPIVASRFANSITGTVTVHVPGFTVVALADSSGVTPRIGRDQAESIALTWISHSGFPPSHGSRVVAATFEAHVVKVQWADGGYETKGIPPENLWLIQLAAPPQGGNTTIEGDVLVDADTGEVPAASQYWH